MTLTVTNKTIDKYFGFLRRLDNNSKRKLINKLKKSIENQEDGPIDLASLYGAWEDSKDSDEIIHEIRNSRIDRNNTEEF